MVETGRSIVVEELTCLRCLWNWWPKIMDAKVTLPERCPGCNSPYWNKPYQKKS